MNNSDPLQHKLKTALAEKGPTYRPRTRHLRDDGQAIYVNRLILEDSPYLLQHAHNPVNWYPWGEEAFIDAKAQDKPIFLSIGYATCHWCHVMEEESFESIVVAEVLNEHFICIKVDREQYPDIDATYMTAVTLFTGHGGWPMSSFLCPDGKPFFGGTYYPQANFIDLLTQINRAWHEQRDVLVNQSEQLADAVEQNTSKQSEMAGINKQVMENAVDSVLRNYDARFGGFSGAPKFPHEPLLLMLLQTLERQTNSQLLQAVEHTLTAMARGGIYDQVGGGFHRYSVDQYWLAPHFEKMLYNQAYLARVYLQAYGLTGNPLHARVVRQTLDYALREMTDSRGLFYSATDADSEGHEGTYFVWTIEEIRELLSEEDAEFIIDLYGATSGGNFEGHNILYLPRSLETCANESQQSLTQLCQRLDPLLAILRQHRNQRIPPLTDDKVLVAWNGMMIAAFAEAGHLLHEQDYLAAAEKAAKALWQAQRPEPDRLWRVNLQGKASVPARQDDYVHFAEALISLYDATGNKDCLQRARELSDEMLDRFLDSSNGALFMGNEGLLFTQPKDSYDGALPSGNAVAVRVLSRLYKRTGETNYSDQARNILHAFADNLNRQPIAYAYMIAQLDEIDHGEIGDQQYLSSGSIKLKGSCEKNREHYRITVECIPTAGWKLNKAMKIGLLQPDWLMDEISEDIGNDLYRQFDLTATGEIRHCKIKLNVTMQACNEQHCLPEESAVLYVGLPR